MYYIKCKCFVMLYMYIMYLTRIRVSKAVVKHFPKDRPKNNFEENVRRRQNLYYKCLKCIKRSYITTKQ